jgi:predicted secreted hydrolase
MEPGALRPNPLREVTVAGRKVPVDWRWNCPPALDVTVGAEPAGLDGTLVPYWEGPIRIEGSHTGRGYLEMTGYD